MNNTVTTEHKTRRWPWIAGIVTALLVGVGIGAAGSTDTTRQAAQPDIAAVAAEQDRKSIELDERKAALDARETEINAWVAPEPETVEVTPDACLEALDYAEEAFGYASEFAGYTGELAGAAADAVMAATIGDDVWMNELTDQVLNINDGITGLTAELERVAPLYIEARDDCR